ncbi:DNA polymerase, partial [Candidatus Woesearchaeota archaeon]|nr:DNA polymerase [Candidatus Woesearchaeota archaeon]
PGNYDVVVSEKLLSRFQNQNIDVTYYIALEPDSTFG